MSQDTQSTIKAQKCHYQALNSNLLFSTQGHILIGESYNLDVSIIQDTVIEINELSTEKRKNVDYYDIELPKSWVDECYECFQQQKEIGQWKQKLLEESKSFSKTPKDIYTENYKLGLKYHKSGDYDNAISYFQKCLDTNIDCQLVFYNLACVYSITNDIEKSLQYFRWSFERGYYSWNFIVVDPDLVNIKENPEFVEIIRKMIDLNPSRFYDCANVVNTSPGESSTVIDFILKHNIAKTKEEFDEYLLNQRIQNCLTQSFSDEKNIKEFLDICLYDKYSDWKNLATDPVFKELRESKSLQFQNIVSVAINNAIVKHETDNLSDDDQILLEKFKSEYLTDFDQSKKLRSIPMQLLMTI